MPHASPELVELPIEAPRAPAWSRAGSAGVATALLTWQLAAAFQPMPLVHLLQWVLLGLAGLPFLFVVGLSAVAAVLTALLAALSTPWLLLRRPTGLGDAVRGAWALPLGIPRRYARALRNVRRPRLWGATAGFAIGITSFVALRGFGPAAG